jgi:hypothetical protein
MLGVVPELRKGPAMDARDRPGALLQFAHQLSRLTC